MADSRLVCFLLVVPAAWLLACGDDGGSDGGRDAAAIDAPAIDAPATDAPAADAPATDAPATDAPATDAPATDAPATDAPGTDAGRDTSCDDDTDPVCPMPEPMCEMGSIAAVQGGCWVCVNPATCHPWGEAGCETDQTCPPTAYCDPCGTSSCPTCRDCVAACVMHSCPTETMLTCRCARPDCGDGAVAIIRDGCWVCVDLGTCEDVRIGC